MDSPSRRYNNHNCFLFTVQPHIKPKLTDLERQVDRPTTRVRDLKIFYEKFVTSDVIDEMLIIVYSRTFFVPHVTVVISHWAWDTWSTSLLPALAYTCELLKILIKLFMFQVKLVSRYLKRKHSVHIGKETRKLVHSCTIARFSNGHNFLAL